MPDSDEGLFVIEVELDHGTNLARTQETVEEIEDLLEDYDEVEHYLSTIGSTAKWEVCLLILTLPRLS